MQFHPGNGVSCGKDFTLFSVEEGVVVFEVIKRKKCVRFQAWMLLHVPAACELEWVHCVQYC